MAEPPRRRRLQMHLSTAVWMMIAAGGLIWGNAVPTDIVGYNAIKYGWPFYSVINFEVVAFGGTPIRLTRVNYTPASLDLLVALSILFVVWYVSEWWIKRRSTK